MNEFKIKLSTVMLFVSGAGMIVGAALLSKENIAPWMAFHVLFFVGLFVKLVRY